MIVILLTPAVGGMARLLGVVDRPGEGRRAHTRTVPRLGGLALFLGIFVPALAFLDLTPAMRGLLLGAAVATTVGAIDDFRGLRWWEKLAGQVLAASIAVGFGIWVHQFTFPIVGVHELPVWIGAPLTVLGIVAVMNMVNFLDGLDGLAAGVCAISAGTFVLIELDLGRPNPAILAAIVARRDARLPPPQLLSGADLHGRLGRAAARVPARGHLGRGPFEDGVVGVALPAARGARRSDRGHVVRRREAPQARVPVYEADRSHLHHRFLNIGYSQPRAVLTIYAWCATLAAAALATRFIQPHPHGDWRAWAVAVDARIGLAALAASIYIVYLLEIVKLANPIMRRREQLATRAQDRLSLSGTPYRIVERRQEGEFGAWRAVDAEGNRYIVKPTLVGGRRRRDRVASRARVIPSRGTCSFGRASRCRRNCPAHRCPAGTASGRDRGSRDRAERAAGRQASSERSAVAGADLSDVLRGHFYVDLAVLELHSEELLRRCQASCPRAEGEFADPGDLVHWDYTTSNILAGGDEITGVVDWDGVCNGDRLFDLVTLYYYTRTTSLRDYVEARLRRDVFSAYLAAMVVRQVAYSLKFHRRRRARLIEDGLELTA